MKKYFLNLIFGSFVILLVTFSCTTSSKKTDRIESIDIIGAYNTKSEVLLSSVTEDVEYIRLESCDTCLISDPFLVAANDSIIIVIAFRKILIFDRFTGAFKHQISSPGRGPLEYMFTLSAGYDERNDLIYAIGKNSTNILGFSTDGTLKTSFNKPDEIWEKDQSYAISDFWAYPGKKYIGYSNNYSGSNPFKLEIFDSFGKVINQYPNYNFFDKSKYAYTGGGMPSWGWFYNINDSIRFYQGLTDTIFTITDSKLLPRFHLNMGEFSFPYYLQAVNGALENEQFNYFLLEDIYESTRYLFFTVRLNDCWHLCYYDKKLNETKVCEIKSDKEYYKIQSYTKELSIGGSRKFFLQKRNIGLVNDIDGFVPMGTGRGSIYINGIDELISYIEAADIERWFKMNPEKTASLPENLKKFSDVKATDNIIVMISKLKD